MKAQRFSVVLFLTFIVAGCLFAQVEQKIDHRVQRMKEAMQLTSDQASKIRAIYLREEQQFAQEKQSKPVNKRTALKRARSEMMTTDAEIEKLLTPDQRKKFDSYKKERMNELKSRTKGRKFKEE